MLVIRRAIGPFELVRMSLRAHRFPPHTHDRFALSLSMSGTERITTGGTEVDLGKEDIGLLNPGEVESSSSVGTAWDFVSLYINVEELCRREARFSRRYLRSRELASSLADLAESSFYPSLSDCVIYDRLQAILEEALNAAGSTEIPCQEEPDYRIQSVEDMLRGAEVPAANLRTLAISIGTSASELVRRFKKKNGLPPSAWHYDRKLHNALQLVDQGYPLAAIAAELGYSDQAHMTRRFKAAVGVSPRIWARSKISFNTHP